jgi:hypothetical protein
MDRGFTVYARAYLENPNRKHHLGHLGVDEGTLKLAFKEDGASIWMGFSGT